MIELQDGMTLYHGSYMAIPNISLSKCKDGKDFGKGFYVTSSYQQAQHFIPTAVKKHNYEDPAHPVTVEDGKVSVYRVHLKKLNIHYFETTNADWLQFICCNRKKGTFTHLKAQYANYDVLVGKVANDSTATTITGYISGVYGPIDEESAIQTAIRLFKPERLDDQFCFLTESSLAILEYLRSEPYDPNI